MVKRALPGSTTGSSSDKQASADGTGIQGVFFDLGGTLFSYQPMSENHSLLLAQAVQQMSLKADPAQIIDAHKRASDRVALVYADKDLSLIHI